MALELGKINFKQPQIKSNGFEAVRHHYPANPETPLKTEGLQARLDKIGTGELYPVVSNRTICLA